MKNEANGNNTIIGVPLLLMVTYLTWLLHGDASNYEEPLYIIFVIYNVVDKNNA